MKYIPLSWYKYTIDIWLYKKKYFAPRIGFEPMTYRLTGECSNHWATEDYVYQRWESNPHVPRTLVSKTNAATVTPLWYFAHQDGLEPPPKILEIFMLPLHHWHVCCDSWGIRTPNNGFGDRDDTISPLTCVVWFLRDSNPQPFRP